MAKRILTRNFEVILCFTADVPASPQTDSKLRWRKDQTQWRQDMRDNQIERSKSHSEPDFLVLGNLASEVSMGALDMLEIIVKVRAVG